MISVVKTADLATLCGYASALPTPFNDECVDVDAFESLCDWQIEQASSAIIMTATVSSRATSQTSSTPTTTADVSKLSKVSRLTNTSAKSGQKSPNDSNSIQSIKCRD